MQFTEWLQQQLDKRGWSQRDLIKHVRMEGHQLSPAHLSRIMTGHREPNPEVCIGIADAFKLPREEVFQVRGWLLAQSRGPNQNSFHPRVERLARVVNQMPQMSRELTLDAIESVVETTQKLTSFSSQPSI